jgi:hypothetical protein
MIGDRMEHRHWRGQRGGHADRPLPQGVTTGEEVERMPYRRWRIVDSVADLIETVEAPAA